MSTTQALPGAPPGSILQRKSSILKKISNGDGVTTGEPGTESGAARSRTVDSASNNNPLTTRSAPASSQPAVSSPPELISEPDVVPPPAPRKLPRRGPESLQQRPSQQDVTAGGEAPATVGPPGGSAYGAGMTGSAYGAGMTGSAYGAGMTGSAYGAGMTGSAYGAGMTGSAYGAGMTGSAYGAGMTGSAYGAGMTGSAYGAGMTGSAYGAGMTGSAYGAGMTGSAYGAGMTGSAYASSMGVGSFYSVPALTGNSAAVLPCVPEGSTSQFRGSLQGWIPQPAGCAGVPPEIMGATEGNLYGRGPNQSTTGITRLGSIYGGGLCCIPSASAASLRCGSAGVKEHAPLRRSGKRGGNENGDHGSEQAGSKATYVAPLACEGSTLRRGTNEATKASTTKVHVPADYKVHSLIVVDKDAGPSNRVALAVKDPWTVSVARDDGGKNEFTHDECLERNKILSPVDSVLLNNLQSNWLSGRTSSLLVGCGKGRSDACTALARDFLLRSLECMEGVTTSCGGFDVTLTMGVVDASLGIRDLLNPGKKDYDRIQLASNPVYGPCLFGMKAKTVHSAAECARVFDDAVKLADDPARLLVGFFVLKQQKKTAAGLDVYLSSLCLGIVGEKVSHFTALKDKDASVPHRLFRYAIGGGSVTVSSLILSQFDVGASDSLDVARVMRQVKNVPPRNGSVIRCVEATKKEIEKRREVKGMDDAQKTLNAGLLRRMETMLKDAEEMLSNPTVAVPQGYPIN
ncbi:unnamed protein product [Trypanosoma congolense IL3000]|uniref:WGS project CAEQ00000000 data, annotated contig 491 n=1 Tax=Trypanosoma congolense (strain IL3000) TaxID=1068625 RepID=F9WGD5_TRYCI|nr:unnamed protein product [Trypanosoma congolense IL3000]